MLHRHFKPAAICIIIILVGMLIGMSLRSKSDSRGAITVPNAPSVPVTLNVEQFISSMAQLDDTHQMFKGVSKFSIQNLSETKIHLGFPLVGCQYMTKDSAQSLDVSNLGTFGESKTVSIEPGDSMTIELPFAGWSDDNPHDLKKGHGKQVRYALIFNVPDGEAPARWIAGLVVSEPVKWTFIE